MKADCVGIPVRLLPRLSRLWVIAYAVVQGLGVTSQSTPLDDPVKWSDGIAAWAKAEDKTGDSAARHLASAVLFTCVARSDPRVFVREAGRNQIGGQGSCTAGRTAECLKASRESLVLAARRDSRLTEATVRLAGLSLDAGNPKEALAQLPEPQLLSDSPIAVRYLALLLRGRALHATGKDDEALASYRAAARLDSTWVSAFLAAGTVAGPQAGRQPPASVNSRTDPWYRHHCSILTPVVQDEALQWVARQVGSEP